MRSRTALFALLFVVSSLALPLVAYAAAIPFLGPIISQEGEFARCPAGWGALIIIVNNIIRLLITLAIVLVAPLMISWAGFLLVVNPFNSGAKEQAKKILTNTIVGIVIALAGWMIVNALMVVLYNPNASSGGTRLAAWSQLITSGGAGFCLEQAGAPYQAGTPTPLSTVVVVPTGNIPTRISTAANAYRGTSTASGPGDGRLACAWAVNNVLRNAGVATIDGNTVLMMENILKSGRGTRINQSAAMPGDIVIEAGGSHVGICFNSGCSQVLSNSSSKKTFTWVSGPDFKPSYSSGVGRIYRVVN